MHQSKLMCPFSFCLISTHTWLLHPPSIFIFCTLYSPFTHQLHSLIPYPSCMIWWSVSATDTSSATLFLYVLLQLCIIQPPTPPPPTPSLPRPSLTSSLIMLHLCPSLILPPSLLLWDWSRNRLLASELDVFFSCSIPALTDAFPIISACPRPPRTSFLPQPCTIFMIRSLIHHLTESGTAHHSVLKVELLIILFWKWSSSSFCTESGTPHHSILKVELLIILYWKWNSSSFYTESGTPHHSILKVELLIILRSPAASVYPSPTLRNLCDQTTALISRWDGWKYIVIVRSPSPPSGVAHPPPPFPIGP